MERDEAVQEGLRRSNARFVASMNRILERYNRPFEDDALVSMATLTYDTPDGPKPWGQVSRKDVKEWKKIFKHKKRSQRNREIPEQCSSDFEDEHSTEHQESSENTAVDTSDSGEEREEVGSVRRKFKDIQLQSVNVDEEQSLVKERVQVDVIVQGDERRIPKWITITTPKSSKDHRLTSPVQEEFEIPEQCSSDFEDEHSTEHQESSENTAVDTSDSGEEREEVGSVRRKFKDIQLQSVNVDEEQSLVKERVQVDVIVQGDERRIPKWITITTPKSSKDHRLTSPVQEEFEIPEQCSSDFEDEHSTEHQESSENTAVDTSDSGEEREEVGSVRRKFKDIQLQSVNVDEEQSLVKERVQVDVIVQDDERRIPKWITITTPKSSKDHRLTSPVQEEFGSQAAVCRKKLELSNEHSSSKYQQLQHSGVPISSNRIASLRQRPYPGLSTTSYDSIHGEYQPAHEGCSWSNTTLADLYPAMLETFTQHMAKHFQRKWLKYMFGHLRSKRRRSRRPKLNVTVDKMGGSRACKLEKALHSIHSSRSEDNQNTTSVNESREFCGDNCLISNSSGLVPYAYTDRNEGKMGYSNSDLEQHLVSGKGQEVCKYTAFPDVMDRMGETFIVEDELQTTASPKNSEYTESENLAYRRFSEPSLITSTGSSDSRAFHLGKEKKTQKTDFCVGTSELCSSACSSHGNSNNSLPITNCSPARSSNTVFRNLEKRIPERQTFFQHKDSFSSCFMKQSPSKKPDKYEDAFEELYYKVCSEEFQKSLTLTRPLLNTQNLEEKGRLVKSNLSDFGRSIKQSDARFDRVYDKLSVQGNRRESVPNFPWFQTVSNFRKYEEIQIPETVNALVNSPVRSYSAIFRVKRAGNCENNLPCSPVKRLKVTPGPCFSSRKCQEISHSKKGNPQTAGMDFLSTYNCSNLRFFADHNCHCQGSGSHGSSDKSFHGIAGTSLQESRTAGSCSDWPGTMGNCSCLSNVRKHQPRVYRKLSYTDGRDQL
ncbi:Holliday junction recognition protein [Prinia subflava]|uniref:Holliday junction recognition protein n=1 Tax=Prinia subflava TaxID=208062 RepID=UPI002FE08AD6